MDAAIVTFRDCNGESEVGISERSLARQTIVDAGVTDSSADESNRQLQSPNRDSSTREVAIQANDYDIEKTSSHLPARKRYVPLKFSDYRIFAGESHINEQEDDEDEEDEDANFDPEKKVQVPKVASGRGRGRPKKNIASGEGIRPDGPEKKNIITKVPSGFKCGTCGRIFTLRGNAKAHMITHTDQRPFACDFEGCGKHLRTKESLRRHQLSHLGIKMFECSDCKKKFSSNASLLEHMTRHTGARPLSCNVCGRKFRQVAVLKRHVTTHSNHKPFSCGICGKRFAMKVYVQSHMKTHTGERPFTCDTCNKSFAHASDLNRHRIIHTGKKPYACSVCSMRYSDASSRRRHEREHQTKQQFLCHLCNQRFTRAGQLRSHITREHNADTETFYEVHVVDSGAQGSWAVNNNNQPKLVSILPNMPSNAVVQQVDAFQQEGQSNDTLGDLVSSPAKVQVLSGTSELAQPSGDGKESAEAVCKDDDSKHLAVSEPQTSLEDLTNLQPGCTYRIIEQCDSNHIYELQLEDGSHIPFEELANRISLGDIRLQANDTSLTFIQQEDNTYTVIQQLQSNSCHQQPLERTMDSSLHWQVNPNTSQQDSLTHSGIQVMKEDITATDVLPALAVKVENSGINSAEVETSVCSENTRDSISASNTAEKDHIPKIRVETNSLSTTKPMMPSGSAPDYIYDPDLNSQDYYNWLASFTEECKLLPIPLDKNMFQKISHVQKTLSDFMAMPTGVITDKNNFRVLMSITRDLLDITGKHLSLMLQNLA